MIALIKFIEEGNFDELTWGIYRDFIVKKYGYTPNGFLTRKKPSFIKYDRVVFYLGKGTRGSLGAVGIDFLNEPCATFNLKIDYDFLSSELTMDLATMKLTKFNIDYKILENKIITKNEVILLFDETLKSVHRLQNLTEEEYLSFVITLKDFKVV